MIIRDAAHKDIPELITIVSEVFDEYGFIFDVNNELPDFVHFNEYYRNPDRTLYVVEYEKIIAGCGALKLNENGGMITRVYLRKKCRGHGLGKILVNHLVDMAKKARVPHVCLWTDTRFTVAHNLYKSLGFKQTTRRRPLNDVNDSYEIYFKMNLMQF